MCHKTSFFQMIRRFADSPICHCLFLNMVDSF